MDENKYGEFVAKDVGEDEGCDGCSFFEDLLFDPCPHSVGGPCCMPGDRKDGKNIIWVREETINEEVK